MLEALSRPLGTVRGLVAFAFLCSLLGLESDLLAKLLQRIEVILQVQLVINHFVE